jgi:hypothetical protein
VAGKSSPPSGRGLQLPPDMTLHIDELAPDFEADTTLGNIRFHDWIS